MIVELLSSGFYTLLEYLSAHVLLCLVPAFFISGAFNALIPDQTIIDYMGSKSRKWLAYVFAAISGLILEVCSCTILPLFAGIWKKGSGFGPAITFLFAGPGITLLSTPLTAVVLGTHFAVVKLLLSIIIAIMIGVSMELIFEEKLTEMGKKSIDIKNKVTRKTYQSVLFFSALIMVMVFGTAPLDIGRKLVLVAASGVLSAFFAFRYYTSSERKAWFSETWNFFKMIFPILLLGVFISGMLKPLIPQEIVAKYAGENTITANLITVLFGLIAYFPTLVEVPIAEMFMELGMNKGPLMAYLISDPAVSLQTMLVVNRIMKPRKTIAYALLIIIFSTMGGYIYGVVF